MTKPQQITCQAIKKTVTDQVEKLFFNKVKVEVDEADSIFHIKQQVIIRSELWITKQSLKSARDAKEYLDMAIQHKHKAMQNAIFKELANNIKPDKAGLKLIVSSSIPEGTILCDPQTAHRVGFLQSLIHEGHPQFREELDELLQEQITISSHI